MFQLKKYLVLLGAVIGAVSIYAAKENNPDDCETLGHEWHATPPIDFPCSGHMSVHPASITIHQYDSFKPIFRSFLEGGRIYCVERCSRCGAKGEDFEIPQDIASRT